MKRNSMCLISILLIIAFAGCNKAPERTGKADILLSQELKDYVMFPVGTWWVYENEEFGYTDSVVVMKQFVIEINESGYDSFEKLMQGYYSSYKVPGHELQAGSFVHFPAGNQYYLGYDRLYYADMVSGDSLNRLGYFTHCEQKDSVNIAGTIYHDVRCFTGGGNSYYWCKKYGLIYKTQDINLAEPKIDFSLVRSSI